MAKPLEMIYDDMAWKEMDRMEEAMEAVRESTSDDQRSRAVAVLKVACDAWARYEAVRAAMATHKV